MNNLKPSYYQARLDYENLRNLDGDPEACIEDYITAVYKTLKFWLMVHTDPYIWGIEWLGDSDPDEFIIDSEGTITLWGGEPYKIDLTKAKAECLYESSEYSTCNVCGIIYHNSDYCPNFNYGEKIKKHKKNIRKGGDYCATLEELIDYVKDYDIEYDYLKYIHNDDLFLAICDAFEVYRELVSCGTHVDSVIDEVTDALEDYDQLSSNLDRLVWAMRSTSIYHVGGNIIEDYSVIDPDLVNRVRNDSLTSVWSEEEINEFLEEDNLQNFADVLNDIANY